MVLVLVAGQTGCVLGDPDTIGNADATVPSVSGVLALGDADVRYVAGEDEANFGWAVAGAGDADGDGLDDIVFSSPWSGTAWFERGPVSATLAGADTVWSGLYAGYDLDGGDDYDGDGLDDVVMGMRLDGPTVNRFAGGVDFSTVPVVRVFQGESDGVLASFDTPSASLVHAENADLFLVGGTRAYEVAWVDGMLAVGNAQSGPGADRGVVWLLTALPVLGELDADAHARLIGDVDFTLLGSDVRAAGDTDGDGTAEVMASTLEARRRVVVAPVDLDGDVLMDDGQTAVVPAAAHQPTGAQDGGVDVTGDGLDDVLLTMSDEDASAPVWSAVLLDGPIAGARDVTDNVAVFQGRSAEDLWVQTARFAGDVDGDGSGDILVGAEGSLISDPGGVAALFLGPHAGTRALFDADILFPGESRGADTGHAIDAAGDLDGDGLADLLIGAPDLASTDDSRGAVYVVLGATLFP